MITKVVLNRQVQLKHKVFIALLTAVFLFLSPGGALGAGFSSQAAFYIKSIGMAMLTGLNAKTT
ncbi:hypothetical protein D3C73_722590 [compost metagenome]